MDRLLGRKKLLDKVEECVLHGSTLVLLGPLGIGKTSILRDLSVRLRGRGCPCGLARDTHCLGDVTTALERAYPDVDASALTQRRLRSRLRLAVEARPSALLLDHVSAAGTAMKGYLRSLRGTGLGVILAADVENRRDHAAVRALHLTHMEMVVPPLAGSTMAAILERAVPQLSGFAPSSCGPSARDPSGLGASILGVSRRGPASSPASERARAGGPCQLAWRSSPRTRRCRPPRAGRPRCATSVFACSLVVSDPATRSRAASALQADGLPLDGTTSGVGVAVPALPAARGPDEVHALLGAAELTIATLVATAPAVGRILVEVRAGVGPNGAALGLARRTA